MNLYMNLHHRWLLPVALCLSVAGQSQTETISPDDLRYPYQLLDSGMISTGILLDRTISYGIPAKHTGSPGDPIATRSDFMQLFLELSNAAYSKVPLPTYEEITRIIGTYHDQGQIPIGLISYDYQQLLPFAADSGWIGYDTVTGRFYDIPSGHSPYKTAHTFLSAALTPNVYDTFLTFILPGELLFVPEGGYSIEIDFHDGHGFRQVVPDIPVRVVYVGQTGRILLATRIVQQGRTYSGNSFIARHNNISAGATWSEEFLQYRGCSINNEFPTGHAKAYVIYSQPGQSVIRKPLVFIEGFDADSDPTDNRYGDIGLNTFLLGETYDESGNPILPQLEKLPLLMDSLARKGYDVIIVDFKNGVDHIETNANTVIRLIQYINAVKEGNEEIVMIGASMGGLVGRYALRYMEMNNCHHCVRFFGTFDTPHQGANIPLSVQRFMQFFSRVSAEARNTYNNLINSPAAKQMLTYHINTPPERGNWEATLSAMGHPRQPRLVAVTCGNANGTGLPFSEGAKLISYEAKKLGIAVVRSHLWAVPHSPHTVSPALVFNGKVSLQGGSSIFQLVSATASSMMPTRSIENCPGGIMNSIGQVYESLKTAHAQNFNPNSSAPTNPSGPDHCFIPTISALDIYTTDLFEQVSVKLPDRDEPVPGIYPFAAYYASADNLRHVEITDGPEGNIAWLLEELEKLGSYPASKLPATNGASFNYGDAPHALLPAITIANGGSLKINANQRINYGTVNDPIPVPGQTLKIHTSDCNAEVIIDQEGSLVLGEVTGTFNNKAQLFFGKNSRLEIRSGGTLRIRDSSRLVIGEGAVLLYHPGAQILLEGANAVLEISGLLVVAAGARFTFTKGSASTGGYLKWKVKATPACNIFSLGNTASFHLQGDGQHDKLLELETDLMFPVGLPANYFSAVQLNDGYVIHHHGSKIHTGSPIQCSNVKFESTSRENGTAVHIFGQTNQFNHCKFGYFQTGILADLHVYGHPLVANNTEFFDCSNGIHAAGEALLLNACTFSGNRYGIYHWETDAHSRYTGCNFWSNSTAGIYVENNGHHYFNSCWFFANGVGIRADNPLTRITVRCTAFEFGTTGISSSGVLNLSNQAVFPNITEPGGYNTFFALSTGIGLTGGSLYLHQGANNFIAAQAGTIHNFITGTIPAADPSLVNITTLPATGNFWNPAPSYGNIANGSALHYQLKTRVNGHETPVTLTGSVAVNRFPDCYPQPRSSPFYAFKYQVNDTFSFPVKAGANPRSAVTIYPNPVSHNLYLKITTALEGPVTVLLTDMQGKQQLAKTTLLLQGENVIGLQLHEQQEGAYLLSVTGNDLEHRQKIIVQH